MRVNGNNMYDKIMYNKNIETMVSYFREGCKDTFMMGLELEHFVVDSQNALLPYSGEIGVEALLGSLSAKYEEEYRMQGRLIGLWRKDCSITIEPAGQLEVSISPQTKTERILEIYAAFREEVDELLTAWDCHLVECGYLPKGKAAEQELIPKKRYQNMDAYFAKIGDWGRRMMRGTAATQVSVDYTDEEDFVRKYEAAYKLMPILSWITDNVPVFEDAPNEQALIRTKIWQGVDNARTNVYDFLHGRPLSFQTYAEFAYNTPLIVVREDGEDKPTEKTATQYYADRPIGREETEQILSMVFPCVRLKKVLELRGADSMPIGEALGYAVLVKCLLEKPGRAENWLESVGIRTIEQADALTEELLNVGERAVFNGQRIKELTDSLFAFAELFCEETDKKYLQLLQKRKNEM